MTRHIGLTALLSMVLFLAAFALPARAAEDERAAGERPNVIIFVADDAGWNDFGAYGHPHIRTPNIDRLAGQGMKFERAFLTISSCSPSRASILTGRYPHNTGAGELHMPVPGDQTLFTRPLNDAGYYTVSAGKWHLGDAVRSQFDKIYPRGGPSGAEHWLEAVRNRPMDQPFFMWMAASDPHRGYSEDAIDNPHQADAAAVPPYLPDVQAVREDLANYYDEITRFDQNVGKVLEELERQGVEKNTVVMVISDNGRPFPRAKTTLYDSGIKTPLIVRWPGTIEPGSVSDSLVSTIDIAPTVLDLAGLEPLGSFQGRSFIETLRDPSAEIRDYAFAEHNWHDYKAYERAVRSPRWLYIRNWLPQLPQTPPADAVNSPTYDAMRRMFENGELTKEQAEIFTTPTPEEELYDTRNDPFQLNNLADDPAHAEKLEQMRQTLQDWRQRTNDEMAEELTPDIFDRETGDRLKKGARP